MTEGTDKIDPSWLFDDYIEFTMRRLPDGMCEFDYKTSAERGAVIQAAIERVEKELPRSAETTDEQHRYDAFIELSRRHHARKIERAEAAMASIRDADKRFRRTRLESSPRDPNTHVNLKVRE
jgi:hypothetical protein